MINWRRATKYYLPLPHHSNWISKSRLLTSEWFPALIRGSGCTSSFCGCQDMGEYTTTTSKYGHWRRRYQCDVQQIRDEKNCWLGRKRRVCSVSMDRWSSDLSEWLAIVGGWDELCISPLLGSWALGTRNTCPYLGIGGTIVLRCATNLLFRCFGGFYWICGHIDLQYRLRIGRHSLRRYWAFFTKSWL